jgi:hypothetical protein
LKSNNDFRQGPFPRNGDKAQASSTLRHLGLSRKRTQGASVSHGEAFYGLSFWWTQAQFWICPNPVIEYTFAWSLEGLPLDFSPNLFRRGKDAAASRMMSGFSGPWTALF